MKRTLKIPWAIFRLLYLMVVLGGLAACDRGRRAETIDAPICAIEAARVAAESDPLFQEEECWVRSDWWNLFNDAQLTEFIRLAYERNPTLQTAYAKILMAAANADKARSSLLPYIFLGGDFSRQKLSKTGVIPFGETKVDVPLVPGFGIPVYFSLYESQLNLTYEFDLWGKNRNTLRAAIGEMRANVADLAFAQLQLGIAIAEIYFHLQIDYKRQAIAKELLRNRSQYAELVAKRKVEGLDPAQLLNTRKVNVASSTQGLLQIQGDIAVSEYQLKTYLAGDFEEDISDTGIIECPLPKVPLPKELPLHLLSHRPDIRAKLWLIESAGRQIEVAKAGFYPDFNISAFFGFQTIHFHELFRWASSYFNVNPAFTLPIFDAGRLLANLRGSEVNYDLAIFDYNNLVLNAAKEVLDGIVVLRNNRDQLSAYEQQLKFNRDNLKLVSLRVANNLSSTLDYLTSEESALLAQDQEIVALGNTIQAILELIKALGGGYDARCWNE